MEQERKRIKRAAVSDETRHGHRRAAVNPNARKVDEEDRSTDRRSARRDNARGGASR